MEAQAVPRSLKSKKIRRIISEVPQDESQVSVGGLLALGYVRKRISRNKRENVNFVEDIVIVIGSK